MHNLVYLVLSWQCKITTGIAHFVECTLQWAGTWEKRWAGPSVPSFFFLLITISPYYPDEKKWITGCILFQTCFLVKLYCCCYFSSSVPIGES